MQTGFDSVNAAGARRGKILPSRRLPRSPPVNNLLTGARLRWTRPVAKHLKHIGVVSALTVVSRVLGLLRDRLSAHIFGTTLLNSVFVQAFRLPNLFRRLLGEGALTAAFVPTLQGELHHRGRAGAFALLNQVASWLALVSGTLVAVVMLVLSQSRLWPGLDERWYRVADLTAVLFPYMAFVCLAAAFNGALQVLQRFTEPALSPIWLNLAMIASLGGAGLHFASTPEGQMAWLCGGVLAGGFLQMAVPAAVLLREGWRPRPDFALSPCIREIARLMTPGFLGTAIYQINIYVAGMLAVNVSESANTLLFYANRLMELPIGVFAIAVSTVVYPLLAKHAAAGQLRDLADDYRRGIRLILMINVPAAAGLALLAEPIIRTLFETGKFTAADTAAMVPLLALFAVGMPFFSIASLTVRAFYALKDTAGPVRVAVLDFCVNLGLALLLLRPLGAAGLVLASTVAIIVQTVLLKRALGRKVPELGFAPLWPSVGKVLAATAGMAVLVGGGWWALRHFGPGGRVGDVLGLCVLIPVGAAFYGWLLWNLRIEGREDLEALVAKFRRRRTAGEGT
jgi:putative peptidoglycan lipid II flippase